MEHKELIKKIENIDKKLKKIRLPHGEGSIFWKRKESCYLGYRKMITYPDGISERHTVYANDIELLFSLMKRAESEKKEKWRLNHMPIQAISSKAEDNDIILSEAIKHWFYKFRYLNKRGRTFDREESTLKNQVLNYSSFSNTEIQAITDITIQDHITEIMQKYSYSTVKKTYELLSQFFHYYYSRNINNNPMNTVRKPKESDVRRISIYCPKDVRYFSPDEIKIFKHEALLTWSNGRPKYKFGVGLLFIMYTGIRVGEALACKWKSIDFAEMYLTVNEAASYEKVRDNNMQSTGRMKKYNDAPKTKAGIRRVYLLKQAMQYAEQLKTQQLPQSQEEYVFATSQGCSAVSYYNLRRAFNLICKNCGIQDVDESMGLHVLRHTFISMLCRKGVDKLIIASIVGQSDTEMISRVYYHIMQEEKDAAIKRIEEFDEDKTNNGIVFANQLSGADIDIMIP